MNTPNLSDEERQFHRKLAVDGFNAVWGLMTTADRSPEETDRMIHTAHASRFHWGIVGQPVNLIRGEWQVSRMYSVLGRAEPCQFHARRCYDLCREHGIGGFDLGFAFEALARAAVTARDLKEAEGWLTQAQAAASTIDDVEDRQLLEDDLADLRKRMNP